MDPNPWDRLRQLEAIDSQIYSSKESIRESVQALSQRRNELAPISSLPTEILIDIILLASAKRGDFGLGWLNVTHVCRQWREIALNQRLFWSHINLTNLTSAGAVEMLARAKEAPLHLKARLRLEGRVTGTNQYYFWYNELGKVLQVHVFHIRHLDIIAEILGTWILLQVTLQRALVASPAPILEHLSLSNRDPAGAFKLSIPNNLFKGITPRLFSLELRRVMISWKSPLLRGLKYLRIYQLNDDDRLSVTDWLDALDKMPQLKELALTEASPLADGFTFPSHIKRTATLPVLTCLELSSTAWACALALAHLVLPALTSLNLHARSFDDRGYDALILLPYVTPHAHGPQDAKPLQSVLFRSEEECTRIVAWTTRMPDIHDVAHRQQGECTARVVLTITCDMIPWYSSAYVWVLDAAIEALPLDGLVTLTTERLAPLDEQVWLRHAPRWPLLEHVQLTPRAACGLAEMLLLEDNCGHESPLLPSLRQLDLIGLSSLTKRRTLRLCNALKKRMEQGVPLKVLSWTTHKWTIDTVWLLRRFVADVRGPKGQTSWRREEPPGWDPETCHFVDGYDDSDEEKEGMDDPDEVEVDEEEEEDEGSDDEVYEDDDDDDDDDDNEVVESEMVEA